MRTLTCLQTGQPISLVQILANSGEADIWRTDCPGQLAKIYYSPKLERIQKLEAMIAHPPQDPNAYINHISFAWPTSLLEDSDGVPVGFLMPEVKQAVELLEVYSPLRRQKVMPEFNWLYLHATAMNIASLVWAIQLAGYVLGDLKPQNILVNNGALPSIIDTDSFQVRHPKTGMLYRCPVGSEGFTPPELLGQDLATVEQTEIHDRFRLAVLIYLLLCGDHPFKGRWIGPGDSPDPNELLQNGWWPYAPNSPIQPSALTTPLSILHPDIQTCFLRCFNTGHLTPAARPTASEWVKVLQSSIAELKRCRKVKNHYFSKTSGKCYWCARKTSLGVDIFPAVPAIAKNPILKTAQRIQAKANRSIQSATRTLNISLNNPNNIASQTLSRWQLRFKQSGPQSINPISSYPPQPKGTAQASIPPTIPTASTPAQWTQNRRVKIAGGIILLVSLFVGSGWFSQSKLEPEDMDLTLVGGGLCLGLVVFCIVLINLTAQSRD